MTELIRKFSFQIALILSGMVVHAQVSPLQNILNKAKSHKNFSYQSVYKQKDNSSDTFVREDRYVFEKTPADTSIGYLFSLESQFKGKAFPTIRLYNGQSLIDIDPNDSTYTTRKIRSSGDDGSMLDYVKLLEGLFETKPSQTAPDTTVDGIVCTHIVMKTYDTVIDKEHCYTRIHMLIDRTSGMPVRIIGKTRTIQIGNAVTDYYMEYRYFNYQFDQDNVDIASMTVPAGFHLPQQQADLPLLSVGTPAPDWVLYTEEGKRTSLSELKGKIVLMDFFFIGCWPCMQSLKPIHNLHEQYKKQDVVILSMTPRDSAAAVKKFKKGYNLEYPIYINAQSVATSYHVENFPTFYLIGRDGKIAKTILGYEGGFEKEVTLAIDSLLNK